MSLERHNTKQEKEVIESKISTLFLLKRILKVINIILKVRDTFLYARTLSFSCAGHAQ